MIWLLVMMSAKGLSGLDWALLEQHLDVLLKVGEVGVALDHDLEEIDLVQEHGQLG